MMRAGYSGDMRTTIDLPEDLHQIATSLARDEGSTLSDAVARLMRRGLTPHSAFTPGLVISPVTGRPALSIGRPITSDDVRAMEDEW